MDGQLQTETETEGTATSDRDREGEGKKGGGYPRAVSAGNGRSWNKQGPGGWPNSEAATKARQRQKRKKKAKKAKRAGLSSAESAVTSPGATRLELASRSLNCRWGWLGCLVGRKSSDSSALVRVEADAAFEARSVSGLSSWATMRVEGFFLLRRASQRTCAIFASSSVAAGSAGSGSAVLRCLTASWVYDRAM
ncbi:hypothetical protein MGYG_09000 [Nannizzia gypsea CBS 118893]|uniref:Uncharacterized protein n=1 Tax=Arthroderma gypseum (strain ATCC MYA-4604 / CBS 118893) TaxID=535722 RepID=E4UPS7_ARTGP|nr:hypothetical protein MGYG_09000 [Nannizzia gypsea CBS 118893]EFQ99899.1 hypothetical protein MGYG_09000 [Nannizzia gypsea CBS 118893]